MVQADMGSLMLVGCVVRPEGGWEGKVGIQILGVWRMLELSQ
jgi:hypothetical protein